MTNQCQEIKWWEADITPKKEIGNWKHYRRKMALINKKSGYEVDLERLTNAAQILDFIFQLEAKSPPVKWDVEGFIRLLNEATYYHFDNSVQGVFCPCGELMQVDWRKKTYQPMK